MEIKKDAMTPKERMQAFAKGEPIDRIPCTPSMGVTLSSLVGKTTREYYTSAEVTAEVEIAIFRKFRQDGVGVGVALREIAEAMGTKVAYPENDISYVEKPALNDINEVSKLSPCDPYKDGKLPLKLKAVKIVNDTLSKEVNIGFNIPAPFTTASDLLGTEKFLKALIKNPEKVHELLEIVTESNFRIIDIVANMGIGFSMSDPISSSSIISKRLYEKFSMPYTKMCVDRMREKSGKGTSIHVCGKSKEIWDSLLKTGIVTLSIDNIEDMEVAKKSVGDKVCLVGNIPPVDIVRYGTYDDVVRESKLCIKKAYDSPKGFILNTGCQIPLDSPIENIQAIMDTARSFGAYPIKPELW